MQDLLLAAGKNPFLRRLLSDMGVPAPVAVERQVGAIGTHPLADRKIIVASDDAAFMLTQLADGGADVYCTASVEPKLTAHAVAAGRSILSVTKLDESTDVSGLIFDARGISSENTGNIYRFFHRYISRLQKNGRVLVVSRGNDAIVTYALEGFMRSLAKEIGSRAATANMICAETPGTEALTGPVRFFMSRASCYVTGQVLKISGGDQITEAYPVAQSLKGKVALVTGAAHGIGAEIAGVLAAEGAYIVCLDRPQESEALAQTARKVDGHIFYQDLAENRAAEKISAYFAGKFKGLDIVVHNAGITLDKTLKKMPAESWQRVMDINLSAPIQITRRLLDDKTLNPRARVVCLSSIAGIAGNFGQTNYAASKAALRGFVAAMADEFSKNDSTINAVAPGFIETRMTEAMPFFTREVGRRLNNLGQGGRPEDVAQVISFLVQPAAFAVNGQTLRVCGGSLIGA